MKKAYAFFYKILRLSRPLIIISLVGVLILKSLSPILSWLDISILTLASIILPLLVFLVIDLYRDLSEKQGLIDQNQNSNFESLNHDLEEFSILSLNKLESIREDLASKFPPVFENFSEAQSRIFEAAKNRLSKNGSLKIRILAITCQFSWKFIEDYVPQLLEQKTDSSASGKPKVEIEIAIVKADVLRSWGQKNVLCEKTESTLKNYHNFKKVHRNKINSGALEIGLFLYDNIPHWHGVILDNQEFFMGRCSWQDLNGHTDESPYYIMQIGQREYRHFKEGDIYQGADRVYLASNWFEVYKYRALKNGDYVK